MGRYSETLDDMGIFFNQCLVDDRYSKLTMVCLKQANISSQWPRHPTFVGKISNKLLLEESVANNLPSAGQFNPSVTASDRAGANSPEL